MHELRWNQGNAKLPKRIIHFSLPSGHSCPAALKCLAKADYHTGKITDGPEQEYRCYAAMQEARHTHVRKQRWNNLTTLKRLGQHKIHTLLKASLTPLYDKYMRDHQQTPIMRAHVGGDFFKDVYFHAWMDLARSFQDASFYAYTKRVDLWVLYENDIAPNFELNASRGGKFDDLIDKYNLKSAEVVYSEQEAKDKNLEIDHDDSHAYLPGPSFAQLIHGCQAAGSDASKALSKIQSAKRTVANTS